MDASIQERYGPTPQEKVILDDVAARTGRVYKRLGGIALESESDADEILPVLTGWIPRTEDDGCRETIYSVFASSFAWRHTDVLLSELSTCESPPQALILAIAYSLKAKHAPQVWEAVRGRRELDCYFFLLSRLVKHQEVKEQVVSEVLDYLSGDTRPWALQDIASINDHRIATWFIDRSDDPAVAPFARRLVARGSRRARGVRSLKGDLDRTHELYSTEVDFEDLPTLLTKLAATWRFRPVACLGDMTWLEGLSHGEWAGTEVRSRSEKFEVWFRLEDIDIVEVVLLVGSPDS